MRAECNQVQYMYMFIIVLTEVLGKTIQKSNSNQAKNKTAPIKHKNKTAIIKHENKTAIIKHKTKQL